MPHTNSFSASATATTAATKVADIITFGAAPLTIENVNAIATASAQTRLSEEPAFLARIQRGADFLDRLLREDGTIYGVTTGYGDSCTVTVPPELVA